MLLGGTAGAAGNGALEARVPFSFAAGDASLAPGTYTVDRHPSGLILLRGARQGAFLWTDRTVSASSHGSTRLVFHRYGDRYFLRQVWFSGASGYAFRETRAERETASRRGKAASAPALVVVAAHG
jgi:hypothetical protein